MTITRRVFLAASSLVPSLVRADEGDGSTRQRIAALEARHGGRLGVAIRDTAADRTFSHRGGERFPLCSTWKALAAGFVLSRVDRGQERLDRRIRYDARALVSYSPVTARHVGGDGLSLADLCEAAVTVSDNTAANLLLDSFGGPPALTGFLGALGDAVTRLDRREPELNEATPGDPRDTTTPIAMLETLRKLVLGTALSSASRERLAGWLRATTTGTTRLRAGVPDHWRVGDKTGSGDHNTSNDVAVIWPPDRPPILVAAFFTEGPTSEEERSAVLAEIGRMATAP